MSTTNKTVMELVIFKAKPTYTTEETLKAMESLNAVIKQYKGFIKRSFALSEDGLWMDIVYWQSMEEAKQAAKDIMQNEVALKAFSVIDEKQMQFYHFTLAGEFKKNE